jgi:hypothetical protein
MASLQRIFMLAGGTAALVVAGPAQAEEILAPAATMANSTDAISAVVETEISETEFAATGLEMKALLNNASATPAEDIALLEEVTEVEQVSEPTLDDFLAEAAPETTEVPISTSADPLVETSLFEETPTSPEVAQVTRPLYRGVSPFYIGVGGNIGIIDSGNSAVGDFGFNVISKISLGPRFAVRPMLQFSEDDFNITLPVTYNFNPFEVGGFSLFPSVGAGVDFGDDIGVLVNGGIDVPISRDFTFNGQVNWRVTSDVGLGVSLGVGYNFGIYPE